MQQPAKPAEEAGMTGKSIRNVYLELGVRPIINCQGTRTTIGGSSPTPEVMQVMEEAKQIVKVL